MMRPLLEADEEHAPRTQAALHEHALVLHRQHARLRGHDHEVVLRHQVARGAQAVAVEHGPDGAPVREGHGGGAVPRFHEQAVVLVERLPFGAHGLVPAPRLGDEHHHGVLDGAARQRQQFEGAVEAGGVAAGLVDDGQDLVDVVEAGRGQQGLARGHPVAVAAQRVDLAVVRDHAVGVRQLPAGEGVGAEARVEHGQRRDHAPVAQVGVVLRQLRGREHALVDDRAAGEAGEVEGLRIADAAALHLALELLAHDVQAALEIVLRLHPRAAPDEHLPHGGLGLERGFAQQGVVRGHLAPAEQVLALAAHDLGQQVHGQRARLAVAVAEQHAHAVAPARGQGNAQQGAFVVEELVRRLDEQPRPVAGVDLGPAGPAVVEVGEGRDGLLHDGVGTVPLEVHEKAHPARIAFEARVVEALLRGPDVGGHRSASFARRPADRRDAAAQPRPAMRDAPLHRAPGEPPV